MCMQDEVYEDDWYICSEDAGDYVEFEANTLRFIPSERRNLLGHVAEWRAVLADWQVDALRCVADEDGGGMKIDWGVFMCPCRLRGNELVIDTEGVW